METFGLRRTQSLKSLSGDVERSWVMAASTRWNRKSVSQLVQHYQSCADLRSLEKVEHKLQVSESSVDGRWRRRETREDVAHWGPGGSLNLSRSHSMDFLPQKETSGTKALRALFESKTTLQQDFNSSPQLNSAVATGSKIGRDCPLQGWRSHNTPLRDTAIQRATKVGGGKATNGFPESYDRTSRYSHDDKYSPPLTNGGTPTRQTRDRISTSSSVRDRSALYLSRAAAIDSTGGSTRPQEFIGTPATKAKNSKFQSSAKEMCSACLTPVYPMEKMVANKLILHYNCFCCKHCKKKLSIHNYSSLYGEFYCISHYQQLFKRKGNYDEGFGHKQHKDQWLQKNKGTQEADAVSTPKMTKSNLNRSDSSRESSAGVFVTKSSARELRDNSGADVKGKLKMSWPPEKKSAGVDLMQKTYVKKKISEICKTSTYGMSLADNNQVKINLSVERKDKVTTLSSSFTSGVKERTKMTSYISAEKVTSEEPKPRSDPTKARLFQDSTSPRVLNFFSPSPEKGIILTTQKTEQKNVAPTSKTCNNPTSHRLDTNKSKKSVRFAPNVDVAQYDSSTQLTTEAKPEERSTQLSDQTEQSKVNKSNDLKDFSDKNNFDEFSKEQSDGGVYLEIPEYKCPGETSKISNQEPDVKVESSQEIPQTDEAILNGGVDKVEESPDTQSFTETFNSTEEDVKHQEPSEILQVIPKDSESDNPSPAKHVSGEEASLERNKNPFEKSDSANDQENSDSQRKPVARTNSLKGSAKPAEKTKVKLGSWSKGKSPLSKLFTNKTEPKDAKKTDVKPSGGLLGRLFQSSSEKAEDPTKSAVQDERTDTTNTDDKKTEEVKEAVTEEMKKEGDMPQVTPQEQEAGEQIKEKSHSAEPNTLDNNKSEVVSTSMPSDLLKTSTSDAQDDLTAPEQTDSNLIGNQVSVLESSEATGRSVTEPPISMESVIQASEESINHVAEKSCDLVLTAPFTDDIFVSSAPVQPSVNHINSDKSALMINEEREPSSSTLFDLNDELPENSPDVCGPLDTQVIFKCPSSSSATALSEAAPADPFNLFDSQPIPTKNEMIHGMTDQLIVPDSAPVNQHEDQTSSPPSASSQKSEQVTDFDIFSSSDVLLTQSNAVNVSDQGGADASTNQPSAFPDDIFAFGDISNSTDVFTVLPSTTVTSNSLNDLFGSDTLSTAAPSAQTDIFADDIFASGPQSLTASEPTDVNLFADSLVAYDNNNTEQTADNTVTSSSWMDDLLG